LVESLAETLEAFDGDPEVRCVVLGSSGRSFCAGANFGDPERARSLGDQSTLRLYAGATRLCALATPVVAAVHGPAIGGGLGLAMTANWRVTCPEARFSANFAKIGIHHGFGLSVTLPEQLGPSKAALVLLTGRRFNGEEATSLGMADRCVPQADVRAAAIELAEEVAANAPLAVEAMNRTLRLGLADRVRQATAREASEQAVLSGTLDAAEGRLAVAERRIGNFIGQ
jgi:enoyl-CoA hydratase/carnithine racemase